MKKYFKILLMILIALISIIGVRISASADTGPKPYVKINIEGDTNGMYMTLLSKTEYSGPWSKEHPYGKVINEEVDAKFAAYMDKDNYYYLHFINDISGKSFNWGYHPPISFKILIYDSINDKFITDDIIYNRYAFASVYKLVLKTDEATLTKTPIVTEQYSVWPEIGNFFIRLTICLAIEILLALLFGFRRMEILLILGVNVATQIILNIILSIFVHFNGVNILALIPFYVLSEILVLLIESCLYLACIDKIDTRFNYRPKNPAIIVIYTFLANILSLGLGFVILRFIVL